MFINLFVSNVYYVSNASYDSLSLAAEVRLRSPRYQAGKPYSVHLAFVILITLCNLLLFWDCSQERGWAISIARLNALLRVDLRPINVIVSDGPYVEILS